jgi:hypothetical protein
VLIGCGAIFVIGCVVVALFLWWGVNKAKEAGLDPALLRDKPALAVAKMMVAANPDVELVSSDDSKGTLTIRDKKTGQILTLDAQESNKGKIVFRGENGEEVTFDAQGNKDGGTMRVKTKEGTATFGAGSSAADLPSWLPSYPGAQIQGNFSAQAAEGKGGSFGFITEDSVEQVIRFYKDALEDAGLKVQSQSFQADGKLALNSIIAEDDGKRRSASIQVMTVEGKTQVTVVFASK